jgi:hypothetical protein
MNRISQQYIIPLGTAITIRDRRIASFWHSPWLGLTKPKDIAPSIFAISSRKNFTDNKGLLQDFWIVKLNIRDGLSINQVSKFVDLWTKINEVQLVEGTPDDITWKFTNSGSYTTSSAYKAQFEGMIDSFTMDVVWKNWAPPKHKLFAWHILQNRVWSSGRLHNRGWPNCGIANMKKGAQNGGASFLQMPVHNKGFELSHLLARNRLGGHFYLGKL